MFQLEFVGASEVLLYFLLILSFVAALGAYLRSWADHRSYLSRLKALDQEVSEAKRALRLRSELANEVAHEIKNPITAILCSAETLGLLIGDKIDPELKASLDYIREYGDQLLRLVSDFLDISRAELGQLKSQPEILNVFQVAQAIKGLLESSSIRRKIRVNVLATDRNLKAMVDAKHFKQVLFNLLHNAIKFTPEGGEVQITIHSEFPRPFLKVAVRDSGQGIPADRLKAVFDPYTRLDLDGAENSTGVGLGLAISRVLVRLNGGEITASSEVGSGSCFEFSVPEFVEEDEKRIQNQGFEIKARVGAAADKPLSGQKFLLVDSDRGSREAIAKLLEAWGGMVDQVELANEAVSKIASANYDAVMLDRSSDGLESRELSKLLREKLQDDDTPIIAASSDKEISGGQIQETGADFVLEKPLNGKRILKMILDATGEKR